MTEQQTSQSFSSRCPISWSVHRLVTVRALVRKDSVIPIRRLQSQGRTRSPGEVSCVLLWITWPGSMAALWLLNSDILMGALGLRSSSYKLGGHRGHPKNLDQKLTWADAGGGGEGTSFLGLVREGALQKRKLAPRLTVGYRVQSSGDLRLLFLKRGSLQDADPSQVAGKAVQPKPGSHWLSTCLGTWSTGVICSRWRSQDKHPLSGWNKGSPRWVTEALDLRSPSQTQISETDSKAGLLGQSRTLSCNCEPISGKIPYITEGQDHIPPGMCPLVHWLFRTVCMEETANAGKAFAEPPYLPKVRSFQELSCHRSPPGKLTNGDGWLLSQERRYRIQPSLSQAILPPICSSKVLAIFPKVPFTLPWKAYISFPFPF